MEEVLKNTDNIGDVGDVPRGAKVIVLSCFSSGLLRIIKDALENAGYVVSWNMKLPRALDMCREIGPGLFIVEEIIPGGGLNGCRELRSGETTSGIPAMLLLSPHAKMPSASEFREAGVVAAVNIGLIDTKVLVSAVEEIIGEP